MATTTMNTGTPSERSPLMANVSKGKVFSPSPVSSVFKQIDFLITWLVPFFVFLVTSLLWTYKFMYIPSFCIVWSVVLIAVDLGVMFQRRPWTDRWTLPTGCLVVPAVVLGSFVGLYLYDTAAIFPQFYHNTRKYTNVVPAQPASAVADAGKLVFSSNTYVDTSQSAGFIEETGVKYCVAPIRDGSGIERIEFWAAGIGCCGASGDFYCDAASNADAKGGIVVFDNNGYFEKARYDFYDKARLKAQATFSLQSVTYPMYVRWVTESNLDMLKNHYRNTAILLGLLADLVYFCASLWIAWSLFGDDKARVRLPPP